MKNLEVAVVIPARKEGKDILHTLASIARSVGVDRSKIGIFVVVNQTRDSLEAVTNSNRETAEVIRSLQNRKMPLSLSNEKRRVASEIGGKIFRSYFGNVIISQERAAEEFLDSGMQIEEVNLWEGNAARWHCNVGLARHVGVKKAIPSLADESCAVLNTDADIYFNHSKISAIMHTLEKDSDVHGVIGRKLKFWAMDPADDLKDLNANLFASHLAKIERDLYETYYMMYHFFMGWDVEKLVKKEFNDQTGINGKLSFWGCDSNFRASAYDKAHFSFRGLSEDEDLSSSMWENGLKIVEDKRAITAFSYRFSDRCTGGVGQELLSMHASSPNPEEKKVSSPVQVVVMNDIATFAAKVMQNNVEIHEFLSDLEKLNIKWNCNLSYEQKLIAWKLFDQRKNDKLETLCGYIFTMSDKSGYTVDMDTALNQTIAGLNNIESQISENFTFFKALRDEFLQAWSLGNGDAKKSLQDLERLKEWIALIAHQKREFEALKILCPRSELYKAVFKIE